MKLLLSGLLVTLVGCATTPKTKKLTPQELSCKRICALDNLQGEMIKINDGEIACICAQHFQ